jgi:hypothetical protein
MKTLNRLICAVALSTAMAQSQTLTATLIEIRPGMSVTGTWDDSSTPPNYPAGLMKFTDFDAFCVEREQDISYGETLVYQIQSPTSLANYDSISRLMGGYLASGRTDLEAAAFQWAIWEITNETTLPRNLLDGNVRISTSVSEDVAILGNNYLSSLPTYTPVAFTYLTNVDRQNVVAFGVIPEPGSVGLAALSGLLLFRRRRN